MLLAVQIYAPLDQSPNHRTLYQFCCLSPQCHSKKEGWVCLRDEVVDTSTSFTFNKVQTTTTASSTTWIDDADDWGDDENMKDGDGNSSSIDDTSEFTVPDIGSLTIQKTTNSNPEHPAPSKNADYCDQIIMNVPSAEVEGVDESVLLDDLPSQPTVDIRTFFAPSTAPILDSSGSEFSSFYLNVVEEQHAAVLSDQKLDERAKELWEEYQHRENCDLKKMQKSSKSITPGRGVDEVYEKVPPSHGDRLQHKFITQVQSCPEQLIRYNRGASNPILLKQLAKEDPALFKCHICNATLVFEMQLMPHLGQRLIIDDSATSQDQTPVELGTVLIFSCSKSCWSGVPREEYLVVQTEIY